MGKKNKKAVIASNCVSCGCCVKACPLGAVHIAHGVTAVVVKETCVGCAKCVSACPAGVIAIAEGMEELI